MYPVSENFRTAIDSGSIQHIICIIRELSGAEHVLGYGAEGDEIVGMPVINRQCVEDAETFCFGQMYVGTAEVTVSMTGIDEDAFRSGELELRFGVDVEGSETPEWIPLGVWDISEAVCEAKTGETKQIKLTGLDRLNRLKCPGYTGIGVMFLDTVMEIIGEYAGVEFAQTAEEILALTGRPRGLVFRTQMSETCWDEVRQISQLIGGFACTDRQGRIVFRRFSQDPVLTVPAEKRFSARISEHCYALNGVTYSAGGYSHTESAYYSDYGGVIGFSDNGYIFSFNKTNYVEVFQSWLRPIIRNFQGVNWYPGTIDCYGYPFLDIGDMITVRDGVAGDPKKFLICAETWQFRGPQTLIAPGVAESGVSSSGGSSGGTAAAPAVNIRVEKVIKTVELEKLPGSLYEAERTAARGAYSCKSNTCCFVNVGLVLLAEEDCTAGAAVYHDEVAQEFRPMTALHAGEYTTLSFTVPISASAGTHSIRIAAYGKAEVTDILAHIWGQEITEQSPEYTSASDYTYTVSDGFATVTGYHGTSLYPEIPPRFGGAAAAVIGADAFTDSEITDVYIPEGVTEIRSESGSLPEEYQQTEYLESTGTQYIDPELSFYNDYKSVCEITFLYTELVDDTWVCGIYNGWYDYRVGAAPIGGEWYKNGYSSYGTTYDPDIFAADTIIKAQFVFNNSFQKLFLFGRGSSDSNYKLSRSRIYEVKIIRDDKLIVHLMPCVRKSDGKPGMYDLVRGRFLTNKGTGELICGQSAGGGTGAFMNAHELSHVYIPRSCKSIGEWAFMNTALKKVRIPADCTYYETSFPPGCEIEFYGGGGDYGQLYDGEGYAVVDGSGSRIYVKE